MGRHLACVVGVAAPAPFRFRGEQFAFGTAAGVDRDVDFYTGLLYDQVPGDRLVFTGAKTGRNETTRGAILTHLTQMVADARAWDTLVLVLVGHGFQVRDDIDRPDEADGFDEVFAAADQPIVDDDFADVWSAAPQTVNVVVFADTCSSHSIGILGGRSDEHINSRATDGPSRLSLAASMPWETAASEPSRVGGSAASSVALLKLHGRPSVPRVTWTGSGPRRATSVRLGQSSIPSCCTSA